MSSFGKQLNETTNSTVQHIVDKLNNINNSNRISKGFLSKLKL